MISIETIFAISMLVLGPSTSYKWLNRSALPLTKDIKHRLRQFFMFCLRFAFPVYLLLNFFHLFFWDVKLSTAFTSGVAVIYEDKALS